MRKKYKYRCINYGWRTEALIKKYLYLDEPLGGYYTDGNRVVIIQATCGIGDGAHNNKEYMGYEEEV